MMLPPPCFTTEMMKFSSGTIALLDLQAGSEHFYILLVCLYVTVLSGKMKVQVKRRRRKRKRKRRKRRRADLSPRCSSEHLDR